MSEVVLLYIFKTFLAFIMCGDTKTDGNLSMIIVFDHFRVLPIVLTLYKIYRNGNIISFIKND